MQIAGIHLKGHRTLGDVSLSFRDAERQVSSAVVLEGLCGSGKSLMLDLCSIAWSGSVRSVRASSFCLDADLCRVDFISGAEILVVHIRRESTEGNMRLGALFRDKNEMLLKYDTSRLTGLPYWTGSTEPSGVCSCYPILSDLHTKDVRNSVIMIDDINLGLNIQDCCKFLAYLRRHYLSRNNQLIFTGRSTEWAGDVERRILPGGIDPVEKTLALIEGR